MGRLWAMTTPHEAGAAHEAGGPDDGSGTDGAGGAGGAELVGALHAAMRAVRRAAGDGDVAPGQLRLLRTIARAGGAARPGVLAEALDVTPRSVTSKVDAAERDGYVARRPDPDDRRATLVALTDVGRDVLDRAGTQRASGAGGMLERLTPAERRELVRLLRALTGPDATP